MKKQRRQYDKEFKQMIVELCLNGKSTGEVAEEFGLKTEIVSRWKREFRQHKQGSFSGHGNRNMTDEQKQVIRLKKELREVQLERDILKKAISIFSRGDSRHSGS